MYTDLTVRITIDDETAEISQTVGVRQGDNLSPVLFLFYMSAFAESLETEWEQQGLGMEIFSVPTFCMLGTLGGRTVGTYRSSDGSRPFGLMRVRCSY